MTFRDFGDGTLGHVSGDENDPRTWVIFSIMQAKSEVPRMPQNESDEDCYGDQPVLVNMKVDSIVHFKDHCKELGIPVLHYLHEAGIGHFAWVRDPEGNRVEAWQPSQPSVEMV